MPSRTFTTQRDGTTSAIQLSLQTGDISVKTIETELLQIVFRHNDGLTNDGSIQNRELIDHGPLLFNGVAGLGGITVPEDKYDAVCADLKNLGYIIETDSKNSKATEDRGGRSSVDLRKVLDGLVPEATVEERPEGYLVIVDSLLADYSWLKHLRGQKISTLKLQTTNLQDEDLIQHLQEIRPKMLNVAYNRQLTGSFLRLLPEDFSMEAIAVEETAMGDDALAEAVRLRNVRVVWAHSGQFSVQATQAIPAGRELEIRVV